MKTKLLATAAVLALMAGSASAQQPEQGGTRTAQGAQQERSAPSAAPSQAQPEGRSPSGEKPGAAATQDVEKKAQQGNRENSQQRQGQTPDRKNGTQQGQTPDRNANPQRQGQTPDTKKPNGQADTQDAKKNGQAQTETKKSGNDAAAKAELNTEQRTKISQTIKTQNVKRVTNVNFNINVGTVVPRSYTFYPVPAPVVAVVPAYRGYLYLVVGDQMLILHPRTHEIVAIIAV